MESFIKAEGGGKTICAVYAHNDDMMVGAIQAMKEAGLKPGKDILTVSIDAVPDIFKAMAAGEANATVELTPNMAGPALDAIMAYKDEGHRAAEVDPDGIEALHGCRRSAEDLRQQEGPRLLRSSRCRRILQGPAETPLDESARSGEHAGAFASTRAPVGVMPCMNASPDPGSALLEVRGLARVLARCARCRRSISRLRAGEIHALLGENGAGKSTLIKVVTGVLPRDAGVVRLDGDEVAPRSAKAAVDAGIATVYQEVNLLPNLSVAQNLYLGRQPTRFGMVREGRDAPARQRAARGVRPRISTSPRRSATIRSRSSMSPRSRARSICRRGC